MFSRTTRLTLVLFIIGVTNCVVLVTLLSFYEGPGSMIRKRVTNTSDARQVTTPLNAVSATGLAMPLEDDSIVYDAGEGSSCPTFLNSTACQKNTSDIGGKLNEPNGSVPHSTFQNVRGALSGFESLDDLRNSIRRDWRFNATAADQLRSVLEKKCNSSGLFLTTQDNVRLNQSIRYDSERRKKLTMTSKVHNRLPKKMPFEKKSLKKCSLVGNSGILLDSRCGKAIDDADYVFRFNLAQVRGYSMDVGSKTSMITCNPTILKKKYSNLGKRGKWRFKNHMTQEYGNASVFTHAFSYSFCTGLSFRAQDILKPTPLDVVFSNPKHLTLLREYWKKHTIKARKMSTGLIVFTAAMAFCEEVHLYGYWPFSEDPEGNQLYYHYFDKKAVMLNPAKLKRLHHNMPAEFRMYIDLHNKGAIRLHVGQCDS